MGRCPGRNLGMRLRFDRMHEVRKLDPILNKEYRCIIRHQIKVAFLSIKLGGKTTNIPYRIG